MNNPNTQTPIIFSAIAKSTVVKFSLKEPKNLIAQIINVKLIGSQSLNDLTATSVSSQEVKDFHLGLIMIDTLSTTQLLDPDEDDEDDDEEDNEDDDEE